VRGGISALASLLVAGTTVTLPASTTFAADEVERPAAQRMQLVLKSIKILDDREPFWESNAELRLHMRVWRVKKDDGCPSYTSRPACIDVIAATTFNFWAGTGDTVPFNRSLPLESSGEGSAAVGPEIGFPLYPGEVYGYQFYMVDKDLGYHVDQMGLLSGVLSQETGWGPPGVYDERGWVECPDAGVGGFCSPAPEEVDSPYNPADSHPAFYRVLYELRAVPTADLVAQTFRYDPHRDALCMGIANMGERPAGPFLVNITADPEGAFPGKTTTLTYGEGLAAGAMMEPCIAPNMPAGDHGISFAIDPAHRVMELNEGNNTYRSRFKFAPGGINAQPAPGTQPRSNLALTTIEIKSNGKNPESCRAGKNDIAVTVKNDGAQPASAFRVQLDGDDIDDEVRSVDGLDADKSREIVFEDVRLKKGAQELTGRVTTDESAADANESDNMRTVEIACTERNGS
jgi:hypothetical protein